jgi:hypothetical protein
MAGVVLAEGLKVLLPQSSSFYIQTGFDPVGRHGDGLDANKELHCFLSPREDLVGAEVKGIQSPPCCVLTERHACYEDPCARMWLRRRGVLQDLV